MEDLPMEMRYVPTDMEDARIEVEDAEVEESPPEGVNLSVPQYMKGCMDSALRSFWSDPDVIEQLS